jgi:hypothetical protein
MSYEGFVAWFIGVTPNRLDFNSFDRHALKSPQLRKSLAIFYTKPRDNEIILKQSRQISTYKVYEGPA